MCRDGAESDERVGDEAGEVGAVAKQRRAETVAGVGAEDDEVSLPELGAWLRHVPG